MSKIKILSNIFYFILVVLILPDLDISLNFTHARKLDPAPGHFQHSALDESEHKRVDGYYTVSLSAAAK